MLLSSCWLSVSGSSASRSAASSRSNSERIAFTSWLLSRSRSSPRVASSTFSKTSADVVLSNTSNMTRLFSLSSSSTTSAMSLLRCSLSTRRRAELSPPSSRISICCNSICCTNCFCSSGIELTLSAYGGLKIKFTRLRNKITQFFLLGNGFLYSLLGYMNQDKNRKN
ncbi:hypothetical protein ES703_85931 [subsurface metagenome]